ncbi:hypothetical protein S40288_01708 [Stachybotrys chartarum IBT 40288]|nr:hypothetical protein S40288_01708 [Stachybotrys chartarum IBT 40288]
MAPTKSASLRYKSSPMRRASFRDDTHLVGLRYEKTVAAEPPIPMAPRSPLRAARPGSSSCSSLNGPVVVSPPRPVVAPPTEDHPALRTSIPPRTTAADAWKRDSGHAPTSAATTIYEEECEDELTTRKGADLVVIAPVSPTTTPQFVGSPPSVVEDVASVCSQVVSNQVLAAQQPTTPARIPPRSPVASVDSRARTLPEHDRAKPPSKLAKSFSLRSISMSVLGRRSFSAEHVPASTIAGALVPPLLWGPSASQEPPEHRPRASSPFRKHHSQSPNHSVSTSPNNKTVAPFIPLAVSIPTDSLLDDDFLTGLSFSKRGSIMFGGQRAPGTDADMETLPTAHAPDDRRNAPGDADEPIPSKPAGASLPLPDIRVLEADREEESQKVRSLYDGGSDPAGEQGGHVSVQQPEPRPMTPVLENGHDVAHAQLTPDGDMPRAATSSSHYDNNTENELAGGLEDWEDVDGALVDRYGFIADPTPTSRLGTPSSLKSSQFSPRKRNVLHKKDPRDPMGLSSTVAARRSPSRKMSARSLNTQHTDVSVASFRSSRSVMRQAGNLLPHNRERRWLDEAGDMLTISPSLQDIAEEVQAEKVSEALKRKEGERSEKWRKMAKVVRNGGQGQGMEFEFDAKNPKLIERTWKGIPDRWRAAAWWSFLASSSRRSRDSATDQEIIARFHQLQDISSKDDGQIDLDVPRTIGRHIMFRKRYRGGQRLLFRVLHAISIYFPETGYGQGMGSLAATLLCYFDEERCFVMMVRMWQLRGLRDLYHPNFVGLMAALKEFENDWLNRDVAKRLADLDVDVMSYGTKWYLTLFNMSVPFGAQLRIWDVFLLLGDGAFAEGVPFPEPTKPGADLSPESPKTTGLDILHAAGAALVQALREMILDSDFENAMKALTSPMAIKDEDLLMKVMKAEWKGHSARRRA